jgi:hypothetical protein
MSSSVDSGRRPRPPTLLDALLPVVVLIGLIALTIALFGVGATDGPLQVALLLSAAFASLIALKNGYIAALLATAGATNATLYASSNLTSMLAEQQLFPVFFGARSRLGANGGLIVTTGLVLLVANLVDLSAIASVGSAVALIVFLLVGAAGYRRRADTGSNAAIVLIAITVTAVVLGFFAADTVKNAPWTFVAIAAIALLSVVLDALVRRTGRARPAAPPGANLSS